MVIFLIASAVVNTQFVMEFVYFNFKEFYCDGTIFYAWRTLALMTCWGENQHEVSMAQDWWNGSRLAYCIPRKKDPSLRKQCADSWWHTVRRKCYAVVVL